MTTIMSANKEQNSFEELPRDNFSITFDAGKTWYAFVGDKLLGPFPCKEDARAAINIAVNS